jgi:NAD(P)-dependent dehydrogenase (short-subunit alcohol dehydrogenase family)
MKGRAVIVTGGTGALGSAVVLALIREGARVAVPYRGEKAWSELRAAAGESPLLWGKAADLTGVATARAFVEEAAHWLGRLDGVAAIAGAYAGSGPLETTPEEEWTSMLGANLETAHAICRAALPHLLKDGGSVVTVGAQAVEAGGAGAAAYAVSKAGVQALTRALAFENRGRRVRFNAVVPGTIDTPANRRAMPNADTKYWTPPEEIARVVVFLLSPASAPVTGSLIPVQGRG